MVNIGSAFHRSDAPSPDDDRKVSSFLTFDRHAWWYIVRRTVRGFIDDRAIDVAAALTFFSVLAVFPAIVAIMGLLGVIGLSANAISNVRSVLADIVPQQTAATVASTLERLADESGAGLALIVGVIVAIWSASAYVSAFGRGMNRVYRIDEGRPFWLLKPQQLLVTLVGIVSVVLLVTLLVISGPIAEALGQAINASEVTQTVWAVVRWPAIIILVGVMIAILYSTASNVKQPAFRWLSPGALLAIVALALASVGFGVYASNFRNYSDTYGALGGIVVFLIWLFIANAALVIGVTFNMELERMRELRSGFAAESELRLPPRHTRASEKRLDATRDLEREGARISAEASSARSVKEG
jgi:membrane protein